MHVVALSRLKDLEPIQASWNELAGAVPFRRFEWLGSWWKHYEAGASGSASRRQLMVLAIYESAAQQQLIGLAPWYSDQSLSAGKSIRFLGSGEACTDYLTVLCRDGNEEPVAGTIADWLNWHIPETWDLIQLSGVQHDDPLITKLSERLWTFGHAVHSLSGLHSWRIPLPESWEKYLATLSKSHRKQLRRAIHRYFDSGRARLRTAGSHEEAHEFLGTLVDLHTKRRAGLGKRSCFESATFQRFVSEAASSLFEAGLLRLNLLELDGRPAAADFNLISGTVLYAYQGGIDPERLKLGPGNLLTLATLRQAIREGLTGYDLLRGDEPYKAHWRAAPEDMNTVRIVRNTAAARLRNQVWLAQESMHALTKRALRSAGHKSALGQSKANTDRMGLAPGFGIRSASSLRSDNDSLRIQLFDNSASLAQIAEPWNRLAAGVPLRRFEWLETWWRHFGSGSRHGDPRTKLMVLAALDSADNVVGLAPWYSRSARFGRSTVRFLGADKVCTDYQTVLCQPGQESVVARSLGDWLSEHQEDWGILDFSNVDSRDQVIPALLRQFREKGHSVYTAAGPTCWQIQLPATWDDFLGSMKKRKRQHVRRCIDRYLRTEVVTMYLPQNRDEFGRAFEIFRDLHQRRRQSLGDPGCFADPAFAGFLEDVAERLFDCGILDLLWAEKNGQPIAVGFNLLGQEVSYSYQSGINPDFLDCSPGKLMTLVRLQRAIERGDKVYDFMQGDEPYKKDWKATPTLTFQYRVSANRTAERWRQQVWLANRQARRLAKRGLAASRQTGDALLRFCNFCVTSAKRLFCGANAEATS